MITDMFESTDESKDYTDKYIEILQFFIGDYSEEYKQSIKQHLPQVVLCNPNEMLKTLSLIFVN